MTSESKVSEKHAITEKLLDRHVLVISELPETVPVRVSVDVTEADTHHKTNEAADENKEYGGSNLNQNLKYKTKI